MIAYTSYTASRRTNELDVLRRLAATPGAPVAVRAIDHGPGHTVYAVTRRSCSAL